MNEAKDCPLCGQEDVITPIPHERNFVSRPDSAPRGGRRVGNYKIEHSGGGYDYSHADVCPKLVHAYEKKCLLQFHVEGHSRVTKSDFLDYEDYEDFFRKKGFKIEIKSKRQDVSSFSSRKKKEWFFEASISPVATRTDFEYLVTMGSTPDIAFDLIRHRLLCGEIIEIRESKKNLNLQLVTDGKKLRDLRPVEF